MRKTMLLSAMIFGSLFIAQAALAADTCKSDSDCKAPNLCILAENPPVCKPPQPAGAKCKRDVVCASNKCEIPKGKEAGVCK